MDYILLGIALAATLTQSVIIYFIGKQIGLVNGYEKAMAKPVEVFIEQRPTDGFDFKR